MASLLAGKIPHLIAFFQLERGEPLRAGLLAMVVVQANA